MGQVEHFEAIQLDEIAENVPQKSVELLASKPQKSDEAVSQ